MNNMKIPAEWKALFDAAKNIRPCSFDPSAYLVPGDVVEGRAPSVYLPLDAKRVWFHTYCNEQGVKGTIINEEPNIRCDLVHSNGAKIGFITCNCNIIIDDVVVANATAGQAVFVDNLGDLTMAVQNCSGSAQSRALSNAGFGAVSGTDLVAAGDDGKPIPLPFTTEGDAKEKESKPAPVASDNNSATNTAVAAPAATAEPAVTEHTVTAPAPASDLDELAKAKATMCRVRSRDWEGKSFGEILASPGGVKAIHYYMTSTRMGDANEAARNACKVIWDSLDPAVKASVK
jgi:hypothetical protein